MFKLGVVIGILGRLTEEKKSSNTVVQTYVTGSPYNDTTYTNTSYKKIIYKNGISIGLNASFGVDIIITNRLFLFIETNYIYMTWTPKENKLVEYSENGQDKLDNYSNVNIYNASRAYSSINALLGIRYFLGKNSADLEQKTE